MGIGRIAAIAVLSLLGPASALASGGLVVEPHMRVPPGGAGAPRVALTLDACAGGADQRILRALGDNAIPATVFVTARWLARNPTTVALLVRRADLFEIENHGARHVPAIDRAMRIYGIATAGSPEGVRAEVEGGAQAIRAATGQSPTWFRGATAEYTESSLALIRAMGFRVAGYSIAADGGAQLGAAATAARIARARDGDVLLAHVNHPERAAGAGVAAGILALKARGYRFVRLDGAMPSASRRGPGGTIVASVARQAADR